MYLDRRASGVLLHPTSLPGPGVGDLGDAAFRFVEWLAAAGQSYWQILPLVPVDPGGSPYNGLSAVAGNPLLISLEYLERDGLLRSGQISSPPATHGGRVDFPAITRWKGEMLATAYRNFRSRTPPAAAAAFDDFRAANESWLPDFGLFSAARDHHQGAAWSRWPDELKRREPAAVERWRARLAEAVERYAFQQFIFGRQWSDLRAYANTLGIRIIGDIPIFVAYDSADVWAESEIFQLDAEGEPTVVAGVPPDYFSATGQRWGNPLYRWDLLAARRYDWWIERFRHTFARVDLVRIDHFRGFHSYWEIDAAEETAIRGRWVEGPGLAFFREVERCLGPLSVIAEDLGLITREVELLRDELGYPGMRVLQFGYDGDPRNPHLPENHPEASVAYTGTHDNDTIGGWWASMGPEERRIVHDWLAGRPATNWSFIEAVLASRAKTAVIPLQDLLDLGSEARMNTPGSAISNWTWRMTELPSMSLGERLHDETIKAGRAPEILPIRAPTDTRRAPHE